MIKTIKKLQRNFSSSKLSFDYFGDQKNQGGNYEKYRPKYPQIILDEIIRESPFQNYIDFGCGTGQILYQISPYIQKNIIGNDLSPVQLEFAKSIQPMKQTNNQQKFQFIQAPCLEIEKHLNKELLSEKLNLITVAQALHWFDYESFIKMCAQNLLAKNGFLCALGIYAQGFDYNFYEQSDKLKYNNMGQHIYDDYYDVVGKYFAFKRTYRIC